MASNQSMTTKVAIFVGKNVAGSVVGAAATNFIATPFFSLFGIGDSEDREAYQNKVLKNFKSLHNKIDNVQAEIKQLNKSVTNLQDLITTEAMASVLREFNQHAEVINTRFEMYANAVNSISKSGGKNKRAMAALYTRLSAPYDTEVSTAMRSIHNLMVTQSGLDKGIVNYMYEISRNRMIEYCGNENNYRVPKSKSDRRYIPTTGGLFDCKVMHEGSINAVEQQFPDFANIFKRVRAAQAKGLIFLTAAWGNGVQEPALKTHVGKMIHQMIQLYLFYPNLGITVERTAKANLKTYGKSFDGSKFNALLRRSEEGYSVDPLKKERKRWIMWQTHPPRGWKPFDNVNTGGNDEFSYTKIVKDPWKMGICDANRALYDHTNGYLVMYERNSHHMRGLKHFTREEVNGLAKPMPKAFTALIGDVPGITADIKKLIKTFGETIREDFNISNIAKVSRGANYYSAYPPSGSNHKGQVRAGTIVKVLKKATNGVKGPMAGGMWYYDKVQVIGGKLHGETGYVARSKTNGSWKILV